MLMYTRPVLLRTGIILIGTDFFFVQFFLPEARQDLVERVDEFFAPDVKPW